METLYVALEGKGVRGMEQCRLTSKFPKENLKSK